jgi:hypothetical protein
MRWHWGRGGGGGIGVGEEEEAKGGQNGVLDYCQVMVDV